MSKIQCSTSGSENFEERKFNYLNHYQGKYLLVSNTPVEVCLDCGMMYYDAKVLKKIEQHFFAIHNNQEQPDQYISIPTKAFA